MHSFELLEVPSNSVGIHWFGQSSYALKDAAGTILQVDPYFPRERPANRFIHTESPLDETALRTDYVLLTHDHSDHTWPESLLKIHSAFPACRFMGPPESIATLREQGVPQDLFISVNAGDSAPAGTAEVYVVYAKPPQGAPNDGIQPPDVTHLGYVVAIGGVRVYISGDPINTFGEHDELIEPIAALKPDIGFLTTHPSEGEFPFFDGSVQMAVKLRLQAAVPAHYQCFVERNYDPKAWAACFPSDGPKTLIIPYNSALVYPQS